MGEAERHNKVAATKAFLLFQPIRVYHRYQYDNKIHSTKSCWVLYCTRRLLVLAATVQARLRVMNDGDTGSSSAGALYQYSTGSKKGLNSARYSADDSQRNP